MQGTQAANKEVWKRVWTGLAPPKVEVFTWQLMHERLPVKFILLQRHLIAEQMASCPLCNAYMETVQHLFFHCNFSWLIWSYFLHLWGISCACPGDSKSFLLFWTGCFHGNLGQLWHMLFYVIVWSLWIARNHVVFKDATWDNEQVINLIKLRFSFWVKAKWPGIANTVEDIVRIPNVNLLSVAPASRRHLMVWSPPPLGALKCNVDGSSIGKPGLAGIGGVLRNENGEVLALFSKPIGISESNEAEFQAILEAFILFSATRWKSTHKLIIESDSLNAVKWVNDLGIVPWRLHNFASHMRLLMANVPSWECIHTLREANDFADRLAKEGAHRKQALMVAFQ